MDITEKIDTYLNEKYSIKDLPEKLHKAMSDGSFKTQAKWASLLHADEDEIREIMFKMKGLHVKTLKSKHSDIKTYGIKG